MDQTELDAFVTQTWDASILPVLQEYIRIPNKSPSFDPLWQEHGHMQRAVQLAAAWCEARQLPGLQVEVIQLPGRTPLLWLELAGAGTETVLLYGHLDKQPELFGWAPGKGPFSPVLEGDRLYGRGAADDGYAVFAAVTALQALQRARVSHARCVVLIECCEESGSEDLPAYVDHLAARIGQVDLVICLDSGCGDYERLWHTTSLRGLVTGDLTVEVLREGVHSGDASGIVASSFRIARALLSRLEDETRGTIKPRALHVAIPQQRVQQARTSARVLGKRLLESQPWVSGMRPVQRKPEELLLNRTWRPALAITGAAGLPELASAGNVLRPSTSLRLSLRLPPTCDAERASALVKALLEKQPPYGASVRFDADKASAGWNAPEAPAWLQRSLDAASLASFGKRACAMGEGGSIPFMGMLGERFPRASFVITGVLGPHSNAHGPNEFLHVPTAKRVTACVARVIADHAAHSATQSVTKRVTKRVTKNVTKNAARSRGAEPRARRTARQHPRGKS